MLQLGYTRIGNKHGSKLAIIHGWGCDSSSMRPIANMFKDKDVYLIDLPGYGRSSHLSSLCDDFSATNYLLLNTLPKGCDLMSWSFGSIYALRAISTLSNPCINLHSFTQAIQSNPNIRSLEQHLGYRFSTKAKEYSPFISVLEQALTNQAQSPSQAQAKAQAQGLILATGQKQGLEQGLDMGQGHGHTNSSSICANQKDLIRSLVTICGSPRFPSDPNWQGLSAIKILKCNTLLTPKRLKRILDIFYRMIVKTDQKPTQDGQEQCQAFLQHRPNIPYEVLMAGIRMVTYIDERPSLEYLKLPSLHLFGRHDLLVPCSLANYFEQYTGHKSFIFEHSSHSPMFSEPKLFYQVLTNFYNALDHI